MKRLNAYLTPQNVQILGVQNTVFIVYEYNCIKLKDTSKVTHSIIHERKYT